MSALHHVIGKRALELLTASEQSFWAAESRNMPQYCEYPDLHLGSQWDEPEMESFYAGYGVMDNGRCAPHGPVDHEWRGTVFGDVPDAQKTFDAFYYYMNTVIRFIREGNVVESARFAGTLAHIIQDCCNPGHMVNNVMLNHMFPPRNGKIFHMHGLLDSWPFDPEKERRRPQVLGRNTFETAYYLNELIMLNLEKVRGEIIPLYLAVQTGKKRIVDRIMNKWNGLSVHLTASAWHTLFILAQGKTIPSTVLERLRCVDLTTMPMVLDYTSKFDRQPFIRAGIPFYNCKYPEGDPCRSRLGVAPYPFEPMLNAAYRSDGSSFPLSLRKDGKFFSGPGIASGAYMIASYRVPGRIFETLEVYAGMHPESASDNAMTFAVWCYETEEKLLVSGKVSRHDDALHFQIPLRPECETISFISAAGGGNDHGIFLMPKVYARKELIS